MALLQLRPQAAREDVLAAARDVFEDRGYADASIRLIAERAGVSISSVFADFSDKAEILGHVLTDGFAALNDEFDQISQSACGASVDRLRAILNAHHDVETRRAQLFLTIVGGPEAKATAEPLTPPCSDPGLRNALTEALRSGQRRGEVRPDADLDSFVDTLLAVYAWNYRLAARTGAEAQHQVALMDQQIGGLFDSVAASV
ncbi:MAG TPA: TetR/AcrR family transcriptional regulator [Caulobacteraceae bacterium]